MLGVLFGVDSTVEQLNITLCAAHYSVKFPVFVKFRLFGASSTVDCKKKQAR